MPSSFEPPRLRRLAILGPGLLGGSVALAARERGSAGHVALWARRQQAVDEISTTGAVDLASSELSEVLADADLLVLATPLGAIAELLERSLPLLPERALITDLCSVKAPVVEMADRAIAASGRTDLCFVGSHPMAGSERTGFSNASADLFEAAACAITPGETSSESATGAVAEFWSSLGCRTLQLSPEEHDRSVALVSHLPHVAASALVRAALQSGGGELAGTGFRDTTRVAGGSPEMWAEILAGNRHSVADALESYIGELGEVLANLQDLDNEGVQRFLADAQTRRHELYGGGSGEPG